MSRNRYVEGLERRLYLAADLSPTPDEQQTLDLINRMRANPQAELSLIENSSDPGIQEGLSFFNVDLATLGEQFAALTPAPPLAWNDLLAGTALAHDNLMETDNQQSHQLPGETDLSTRVLAAGYNFLYLGESVFIAGTSVFQTEAAFAVDWGNNPPSGIQDPPGHRENIMNPNFTEVGVAMIPGPDTQGDGVRPGPLVTTEDFGSLETSDGPFLLGSAFTDANADGFYTAGEGLAGINVQAAGPAGTFTTQTLAAGGYQMQTPAGTYTVTFSGGGLSAPRTVNNVVVGTNNVQVDLDTSAPVITSAKGTAVLVGSPGTFAITTSSSAATISDSSATLPAGLAFTDNGDGTGSIAGTPLPGSGGTYIVTLTASSGVGSPSTQKFTITVFEAPSISSGSAATFLIGHAASFPVSVSGFPGGTLSKTGQLPAGVSFTKSAAGAEFIGTPAAGTAGIYTISLAASNGVGAEATQTFTLTIGQLPAITSLNHATFKAGAAQSFAVTGTAAAAFSEAGALPSPVGLVDNNNGTATISGTAPALSGGVYAITINASNVFGTTAQVFTLTVDQAPGIISDPAATFAVGTAGTFSIQTSGFPSATVTAIGALPLGVAVHTVGGQAMLSGTPAANTGKTYAVTLMASNGILPAAKQAFTLTVDQAPAIGAVAPVAFSTIKATTLAIKTTGFPAPGLTASGLPTGLSLTTLANGSSALTGTADSTQSGTFAVTLTATNSKGTATQNFTLSVDHPAEITGGSTAFTVGTAQTFAISTSGFPAPTVTAIGALPAGVTVKNSGGHAVLSGTPAANTGKTYTLTLMASNAIGTAAKQAFTLTVDQAPLVAVPASVVFSTVKATTVTTTVTGFPAATVTATGLPAGLSYNANHTITGTANGADTPGSYAVTLSATNGVGGGFVKTFTLLLDVPASFVSSASTLFTVGQAATFPVTTAGFPSALMSELGLLPAGVRFIAGKNGTAELAGISAAATAGKTFTITLAASNGIGARATQTFSLKIAASAPVD